VNDRRAVLMAVDEDPDALATVRAELEKRYGADYHIVCESSPSVALEMLGAMADGGQPVVIVLADFRLKEMSGADVLGRVAKLHPTAKRLLTVPAWEDRASLTERMVEIVGQGQIDYFVVKPTVAVGEYFHRTITELLDEWTREQTVALEAVRMVGEEASPSTRELRDLLQRNNVPCTFLPVGSKEARDLLDGLGLSADKLPVLVLFDGTVLVEPSLEDIAAALGARAKLEHDLYDVVIVGAGPAGLGAAVYASSEGLVTLVVEREAMGGQAGTTSLIRNYLGFPRGLSGSDLAVRAYEQAVVFGAEFDFAREAVGLNGDSGDKVIILSDGTEVRTRAVILAAGVSYRRLGIPSVEALLGRGVFYGATVVEAKGMRGREVFVVGGGNSAGQAVLHLAKHAARVTLLVRGESLATSMSEYLITQMDAASNIEVRLRTEVVDAIGEGLLEGLVLQDSNGGRETADADALFVFIGASPRTDWLPKEILRDTRGFVLTGNDLLAEGKPPAVWPLGRPPLMMEASIPGVFVAGDARHGSVKRVASAVGEGAAALQACHTYLGAT
jgi:thioredoxin reductase (NADPH)